MSAKRLTRPRLTMKRTADARNRCGVITSLDKLQWGRRHRLLHHRIRNRVCEILYLGCNPELYAIRGVLAGLRARRDTECSREPFSVATCVGRAGPGDAPWDSAPGTCSGFTPPGSGGRCSGALRD